MPALTDWCTAADYSCEKPMRYLEFCIVFRVVSKATSRFSLVGSSLQVILGLIWYFIDEGYFLMMVLTS
jgi:hypothetical protein